LRNLEAFEEVASQQLERACEVAVPRKPLGFETVELHSGRER
jgi:hypothetical protein